MIAVRLSGDDFNYGGFYHGDVILVEPTVEPSPGQTVLIFLDVDGPKWFYITKYFKRHIRGREWRYFRPLRQFDFDDTIPHRVFKLPGDKVEVFGVVRGLIRRYGLTKPSRQEAANE
jgi:SOS-response transcriptional repressor LexA